MSENRFQSMARDYDVMAPIMVPYYHLLQELMLDYLRLENVGHPVVVDLGAGSGTFLKKVLRRNALAKCVYVDLSQPFMDVARQNLHGYRDHIDYILADLEDGWIEQLSEQPDYIFSMSAIHHLENHEKQRLYRRCFEVLKPGGWLVNIDEMKTIYPDAYFSSLRYWDRYGQEQGKQLQNRWLKPYWNWQTHFKKWKARNIDGFDQSKTKGDDIHESFVVQMAWLKEIGFRQVDLFMKVHLWCIIGGKKPV